ncbi:MAG: restriction endonuclease subunit S [Lewinellaceae bacterium]|nr:restriction endonuclease subunit S [Lewinellaceae bacterium]
MQKQDILISRAGTVGKMCVIDEPSFNKSLISTNLIRLSLDKNLIDPSYFVFLMKYFSSKVGRLRKGADGAFSHMNTGVLTNLEVQVPPIAIQRNFIKIVKSIRLSKSKNWKTPGIPLPIPPSKSLYRRTGALSAGCSGPDKRIWILEKDRFARGDHEPGDHEGRPYPLPRRPFFRAGATSWSPRFIVAPAQKIGAVVGDLIARGSASCVNL